MNPRDRLKALLAEAAALQAKGIDSFTDAELTRVEELGTEVPAAQAVVKRLDENAERLKSFGALGTDTETAPTGGVSLDGEGAGSLGQAFIKSDAFTAFRKAHPLGRVAQDQVVRIEKATIRKGDIRKVDAAPINSQVAGGPYWLPTRLPGITDRTYRQEPRLLDLITHGATATPFVAYRQLVSITSNAAIVPEGTTKPLSTLAFDIADAKAVTYADGVKVTNQELADDGILASLIDVTLTKNLALLIEDMVLNGTGTGNQPVGILATTGVQTQAFTTDVFTTTLAAFTKLRNTANAEVEAIVMNPADVQAILLARENGASGAYLGAGPFALSVPPLWGVRIVQSPKVAVGTAIAGDFSSVQLLELDSLAIEAFNQNEDDARKNLTYIRAEQRSLMLNREPAKLIKIALKAA